MGYFPIFFLLLIEIWCVFYTCNTLWFSLTTFLGLRSPRGERRWYWTAQLQTKGLPGAKQVRKGRQRPNGACGNCNSSNMFRTALGRFLVQPQFLRKLPSFLRFLGKPEIQSAACNFLIFKCWQQIQNFQNIIQAWPSGCQFVAFVPSISNFKACRVLWLMQHAVLGSVKDNKGPPFSTKAKVFEHVSKRMNCTLCKSLSSGCFGHLSQCLQEKSHVFIEPIAGEAL